LFYTGPVIGFAGKNGMILRFYFDVFIPYRFGKSKEKGGLYQDRPPG